MIAIAYTLLFCFLGAQMIRWLMPRKSPLVRAWLGVSLGVLMEMGLPALCANALDFTVAAHIAAVAAALLPISGTGFETLWPMRTNEGRKSM